MPHYEPTATLAKGRERYFESNGVPADGGYDDAWVVIRAGRIPIGIFPNTAERVRALRLHDFHHVLTEFDTTLRGEAEIGAWEIASGCRDYWAAWILNGMAALSGLFLCPRKLVRAYRWGRRCLNLYTEGHSDALLDEPVAAARARLQIDFDPASQSA